VIVSGMAHEPKPFNKRINRYLLDVAKVGACSAPPPRSIWAAGARSLAERAALEDHTVAPALEDLADVLEEGDRNMCAAGLGSAWRAAHPPTREPGLDLIALRVPPRPEGDPCDVANAQLDDTHALLALRRAAVLPRPPVAAVRHGQEAELALHRLGAMINTSRPFDKYLATSLVRLAESHIRNLPDSKQKEVLRDHMEKAKLWLNSPERSHGTVSATDVLNIMGEIDFGTGSQFDSADQLYEAGAHAVSALQYLNKYDDILKKLAAWGRPGEKEGMFPDYYQTSEENSLSAPDSSNTPALLVALAGLGVVVAVALWPETGA
jgi:hypothetical protein